MSVERAENESGVHRRSAALPAPEPEGALVKQIVRQQMNQAGNILLAGLEPLNDEEFFAGGTNGISPAWTVGHLSCVIDLFTSWLSGEPPVLSDAVHAVFNSLEIGKKVGTKAELVDRRSFPKADVLLLFRKAQVRALHVLQHFDVARWGVATPSGVPETLPTYGSIWQALGVHTFWHLGELCGCTPRFYGTYTLNTVVHYFYTRPEPTGLTIKESSGG